MSQVQKVKDVNFVDWDYQDISLSGAVIYCDPPYQNTTKYATDMFDYVGFWNWCREMSKNNFVFISEYNAPNDFECIWMKDVKTSLKVHEHENRTEKLFIYKG